MSKLKLLWVGDAGTASGFARVTHSVLDRLHATGRYDIGVLAINYYGWPDQRYPYRLYPASLYRDSNGNPDYFGKMRIREVWEKENPDAVVLFQDFWNIASYIRHIPDAAGIMAYYPVDAPNIKQEWAIYLARTVVAASYTHFGAEQSAQSMKMIYDDIISTAVKENRTSFVTVKIPSEMGFMELPIHRIRQLTKPSGYQVIPHGVDLTHFFPVDKREARERFGFDPDWFIVQNTNRNQPRKRLDLCIKGFAEFAKDKPNARLIFHCWADGGIGWDLEQLARFYDVKDKVILLHQTHPYLSNEDLNLFYNTADVLVNTSGGEGWGLPAMEAAATRVPLIQPDWSGTKEIWEGAALLTPIASVHHEIQGINTQQCAIDTTAFAEQLTMLYEDPGLRENVADKCYRVAHKAEYRWDTIAHTFDRLIQHAAERQFPKFEAVNIAA